MRPETSDGVERLRAVEPLLLRDGEEELERPVLDLRVVGHGHRRRDADPVVGAERRAVGTHPVLLHADVDAPLARIERARRIALAHDVQVRLEDDDRRSLAAGRRRNADDDVPLGVDLRVERASRGPGEDVLARRSLRLRGPRDSRQLREALPEESRLERVECAQRLRVSAAPTARSTSPITRGQLTAIRSTPNQPYRSMTVASVNWAAMRTEVVATMPMRGPAIVIGEDDRARSSRRRAASTSERRTRRRCPRATCVQRAGPRAR